jgi:cupin 2 domain-containing protein
MIQSGNLWSDLPSAPIAEERFDPLLIRPDLRIERIVSAGQASPPGFWYEQRQSEWVLVLAGRAKLRLDGEAEARLLVPGDWMDLPAGCRHRVDWTDPQVPTVWLAVHYGIEAEPAAR